MTAHAESTRARRRHSAGEATRELLMVTAERLIAMNGVEGVSLREIQAAAGQANSSVITYHFGSQAGLVRAVLEFRYRKINARRAELLQQARDRGVSGDPREAVWIIVRPLIESIDAGEMFVPFLARLSEDPRARVDYWPDHLEDEWTQERLEELVDAALQDLPERIRRGRTFQLYIGLISVLAAAARSGRGMSEAQLHNYVDTWVGMLTAPVSYETRALMSESPND